MEEEGTTAGEGEITNKSLQNRKIILILDMAQLEIVKTKKGEFQLLNCDDHINIMKKHNKDPQMYRPDILHQVIQGLFLLRCNCFLGIDGSIR